MAKALARIGVVFVAGCLLAACETGGRSDAESEWNTFLGAGGYDDGTGIAVDSDGNIYVAGQSERTWGSPKSPYMGTTCGFVARFDVRGNLIWNTFLDPDGEEWGGSGCSDIVVDGRGNIYVAGDFDPDDASGNCYVAKLFGDGRVAWISKLSPDGGPYRIALDPEGNIFLAGMVNFGWGSPIEPYSGSEDAFIAKLDGQGRPIWHTFLGSPLKDFGRNLALDDSGNILITGFSAETWGDPVRPFSGGGGRDAFAAKVDGAGHLLWNTFLGAGDEQEYTGSDLAADASGAVFVFGVGNGGWGPGEATYAGGFATFVAKLDAAGGLVWNVFFGNYAGSFVLADGSHLFVTGTSSYEGWGPAAAEYSGGHDVFVAELSAHGAIIWNAFRGSSEWDWSNGIALDGRGFIVLVGTSNNSWGSPIRAFSEDYDVFVTRIDPSK